MFTKWNSKNDTYEPSLPKPEPLSDEFMAAMSRLVAPMFSSPRYRFYKEKESGDMYFWTVEKVNHKGGQKYVAGIYRYLSSKKQWKMVRSVGFAKKYKAKAWALKAFTDKI